MSRRENCCYNGRYILVLCYRQSKVTLHVSNKYIVLDITRILQIIIIMHPIRHPLPSLQSEVAATPWHGCFSLPTQSGTT